MKLDEAIEKVQYVIADVPAIYSDEVYDALTLGIEALKRIKANRIWPEVYHSGTLPGETEG